MEIIIEGHKVDTKDIWDIEHISNTREVWVIIKVTNMPDIKIGRRIPYETSSGQFQQYWRPYEALYNSIKAKWESDKSEIPVFKL